MSAPEIGPADFAPHRAEITGCECPTCREVAYASSSVLDGPTSPRSLAACSALLAELRGGRHHRMTLAERAAQAREEKAARLAELYAAGAPASEIAAVERGYVKFPFSDPVKGSGIGIGGRIQ
ncbi:hypothetical protein [Micromonospora okii]|uniref:hypothetical protein n=1 Tax=Micromonospora okii TaxID=1182970 RepID=UPI001E480B96|nr:hypothetical protein [Micromonospora okii]